MTAWNRGLWVILVVVGLLGLAAGCTEKRQNGAVDPKAFSLWVVPF